MAVRCLTYLCFNIFNTNLMCSDLKARIMTEEYVWMSYSVSNWLWHVPQASKVPNDGKIGDKLIDSIMLLVRLHRTSDELQSSPRDFGLPALKPFLEIYPALVCMALYNSQVDKNSFIKGNVPFLTVSKH